MPVSLKIFYFFKSFVKSVQCARRPAEGIVFQEPELQVFAFLDVGAGMSLQPLHIPILHFVCLV